MPTTRSGCFNTGGERRDRDRRRVRGEDALGTDDVLDPRQELALRREVLDDRLDHELRDADVGQRHHRRDPRDRRIGVGLREPALRRRACASDAGDALLRRIAGADARVVQLHAMAVERGDLRDAGAHRAGADDGDRGIRRNGCAHRQASASATGEVRRPLGDERGDAFAIVVARRPACAADRARGRAARPANCRRWRGAPA